MNKQGVIEKIRGSHGRSRLLKKYYVILPNFEWAW